MTDILKSMTLLPGCISLIFLVLHFTAAAATQTNDKERHNGPLKLGGHAFRSKRNLLQFKSMVECKTNRSWRDFNWYGCYCGYGGKGSPVDELDRCCYVHDNCYKEINKHKLCKRPWDVYTAYYKWHGCETDTSAECVKASKYKDPDEGRCDSAICKCDLAAAECFANSHWDKKYDDWPQSKC